MRIAPIALGVAFFASVPLFAHADPVYDFGGMYGYTAYGTPYVNPATGAASCPAGYTAAKILDTYAVDAPVFFCYRAHTNNPAPLYDFGGMYGYYGYYVNGYITGSVPYVNPATGAASCPSGYTSQQVLGTSGTDYNAYFCYRSYTDSPAPLYDLGGMFGYYGYYVNGYITGSVAYTNPATGAASCPSGYTSSQVLGTYAIDYPMHFCYRPSAAPTPTPTPTAPSCTLTFAPATITSGDSTVLSYTSSNVPAGGWVSINPVEVSDPDIGFVTSNTSGSTSLWPIVTTDYVCTVADAAGNKSYSSAHITVNPAVCPACPAGFVVSGGQCQCPAGQIEDQNGQCVADTVSAPTITASGGACIVGVPQTYTVTASDSDTMSQIHYGFDWVGSRVAQEWRPSVTTYVPQGTAQTITHTWTTSGPHTFQVLAETSAGKRSAWASYTDTCTFAASCTPAGYYCSNASGSAASGNYSCVKSGAACNASCTFCSAGCNAATGLCDALLPIVGEWSVSPLLVRKNQTVTVNWSVSNVTSCTITQTGATQVLSGLAGTNVASQPIVGRTLFTLSCVPRSGGTGVFETKIVNIVPEYHPI